MRDEVHLSCGASSLILHPSSLVYTGSAMVQRLETMPFGDRVLGVVRRWRAFAETRLGARLLPLYAALLGSAVGALIADRLVRSMWRHAIFTGPHQWRTVALILTLLWLMIGAVAAVALLGPPEEQEADGTDGQRAGEVGAHGRAPVQPS